MAPLSQLHQIAIGGVIRKSSCNHLSKSVPDHSLLMFASDGMPLEAVEEKETDSMCLDPESSSKETCSDAYSLTGRTESFNSRSSIEGIQAHVSRDGVEMADLEDLTTQEGEELMVDSSQTADDNTQRLVLASICSLNYHFEEPALETRDTLTGEAPDHLCKSHEMTIEGAERAANSFEESTSVIEQESSIDAKATNPFMSIDNGGTDLAGFFNNARGSKLETDMEDQHHVIPSALESNVLGQGSSVVVPIDDRGPNTSMILGSGGTDLGKFFSSAKGSQCETEIEDQDDIVPSVSKPPPKGRAFMESPHSLRMLLLSDGNMPSTSNMNAEKPKTDPYGLDFFSRIPPVRESTVHEDYAEHSSSEKQSEVKENTELMYAGALSGPIAFSEASTYQGRTSYSGPVPYSGSISHRSDSNASTRSFAFPILASDWNFSSPVKMGAADPRFFPQQRKRRFWFCCSRQPSTWFD